MGKFTPQPEPPGSFSIGGWLVFIVKWIFWLVTLPFQDDYVEN